jgi:hypothetical protein
MTYRYRFQREMAREQRRYRWRRMAYRALGASAVLVALTLMVVM